MTLTNSPDSAAESLAASVTGTVISASYNPATGVLTLTNSDTVAHYQQVLRSVSYNNTSDTPDTTPRVITFVANDGHADSAVATTTLSVTAVNDAPVNSVLGAQTTAENTTLVFSAANGNAISVSDPDAGGAAIQVSLTSLGGYLRLSGTTNLTLVSGSNNSASMTYTGTIADLNAALDSLSFIPTPNTSGSGHLTIVTNDLGNTGTGGPQSATSTVPITITFVDQPPVANNDSYTAAGGSTLTADAAHGVLANDTDVDTPHANLTAVKVSDPAQGTLALASDGSFTYTPNATISNNGGTDTFTYEANDGTANSNLATVTIDVTANQAGHTCDGISNVTAQLQITQAVLRYNAITGRYVRQVTLKNNGAPIAGPFFFVLDSLSGGTLYNKSGNISCVDGSGSPYVTIPGNLGTGGSATANLEFVKTGTITYTPRVLAGTGTP